VLYHVRVLPLLDAEKALATGQAQDALGIRAFGQRRRVEHQSFHDHCPSAVGRDHLEQHLKELVARCRDLALCPL
jgi:hypothetical protein